MFSVTSGISLLFPLLAVQLDELVAFDVEELVAFDVDELVATDVSVENKPVSDTFFFLLSGPGFTFFFLLSGPGFDVREDEGRRNSS